MPILTVNKSSIYFESYGQVQQLGQPLLLLHGLGSCGADWILQIPDFSAHFQVITLDLPGHGQSEAPLSSLTIQEIAKDVSDFLDALQIKSVHVVGFSFGSFVAMQLALDHPSKVKSLILAGSSSCVQDMGKARLFLRSLAICLLPMRLVAKLIAKLCFPEKNQAIVRKICEKHIASVEKKSYRKLFDEVVTFDVSKRLQQIQCPVLIIAGAQDTLLVMAHAEKLHKLIASSKLIVLKQAGHVIPIDSAPEFNKLVLEFLS